jgi:hypothetical protein
MSKRQLFYRFAGVCLILAFAFLGTAGSHPSAVLAQGGDNPNPPEKTVKLIFIHHSTGENWLRDDWGGLGRALGENNYFVSDTNYGWGPDSIGDRTDIPNWPEWFRSPQTPHYMEALLNESGQNSDYTRNLSDPGGENEIIMFKSCFPNSNLDGNPDDPPQEGLDFTVGNAKYIYNDLLNYFRTRPDKLFVVITAPPVQDPTYADNARAFNLWLVQDWLRENNYPYNNVAVFDFYNVLTHPDNHHRYRDGQIEYVTNHGDNTSYYPSSGDDDHPNAKGSRKATEEFIPLLNIFYHRWQSGSAELPPDASPVEATPTSEFGEPVVIPQPAATGELVDDFESGPPADTDGWQAWWDETTQTTASCGPEGGEPYSGSQALHITYSVVADSWMTCALTYNTPQNWSGGTGLSFYVRAVQTGLLFNMNVYGGTPDAQKTYISGDIETTQEMVDGWGMIEIPWDKFLRADWEENAGSPFDPSVVTGMAIGFGYPQAVSGQIWLDDIHLMGVEPVVIAPPPATQAPAEPTQAPEATAEEEQPTPEEQAKGGSRLPCPSPLIISAALAGSLLWSRRRST